MNEKISSKESFGWKRENFPGKLPGGPLNASTGYSLGGYLEERIVSTVRNDRSIPGIPLVWSNDFEEKWLIEDVLIEIDFKTRPERTKWIAIFSMTTFLVTLFIDLCAITEN
jgi:hypothetical protein